MAKNSTHEVINFLSALGEELGYLVEKEATLEKASYSPRYDLVWRRKIEVDTEAIGNYFRLLPEEVERLHLPVVAVFEIEGSDCTTKKQLGNFINLHMAPGFIKAIVINNEEASSQYDIYRRAIKLSRTLSLNGFGNTLVLDYRNLKAAYNRKNEWLKNTKLLNHKSTVQIGGVGGENEMSKKVRQEISEVFNRAGLQIRHDYQPPILDAYFQNPIHSLLNKETLWNPSTFEKKVIKKASEQFYIPKIDLVAGFQPSEGWYQALALFDACMHQENHSFPILSFKDSNLYQLHPLIGIEIESNSNKHSSGGVLNLKHYCYFGILVLLDKNEGYFEAMKALGIKNVTCYLAPSFVHHSI